MIKQLRNHLSKYTWDLAYGNDVNDVLNNGLKKKSIHVIKNPYKKKWFADPFILEKVDNTLYLLVEEFDSDINRGRIAKLTIDIKNHIIIDCKIVLELPTHLSFPAIYRRDGIIYVHPENSASGKSIIYRLVDDKLVDPVVLVNEPLVDSIIEKIKDGYNLYATKLGNSGGKELYVYYSPTFLGSYTYSKTLVFNDNSSRMAGAIINKGQEKIRPAQNCNWDYGTSIYLYYNDLRKELVSPFFLYEGMHTINTYSDGSFIVDLKRYNYPVLHKLLSFIRKAF